MLKSFGVLKPPVDSKTRKSIQLFWKNFINQNPPDHLSRGILSARLSTLDLWWNGPECLKEPQDNWPERYSCEEDMSLTITEARKVKTQYLCTTSVEPTINVSHFSSYVRLIRIIAWIFIFLHKCKSQPHISSDLSSDEFEKAKNYWIRTVQQQCLAAEIDCLKNAQPFPAKSKISRFNPFLQDKTLSLGGRLQFANLATETKHSILLEGSRPFVKLLIFFTPTHTTSSLGCENSSL
ncbi:integrase catalytic domain-containing protein [Trichonephila inaurata madagascariensis]|uniref:Integrase catalytic domain-containing protein n=1 Tax=Trichonephila inaurata madagascariensis TaxID=2747483 RepID=A0A8X7CNH8_9ARAC|nr:integrase catalytic domain-containing protein [Trichonephila inaurata madagascariensis]